MDLKRKKKVCIQIVPYKLSHTIIRHKSWATRILHIQITNGAIVRAVSFEMSIQHSYIEI